MYLSDWVIIEQINLDENYHLQGLLFTIAAFLDTSQWLIRATKANGRLLKCFNG